MTDSTSTITSRLAVAIVSVVTAIAIIVAVAQARVASHTAAVPNPSAAGDPSVRITPQAPTPAATPTQPRRRLQVAANRRYLQYEDGRPFFYMADTAWMLFHRLNREEAVRYLEDRARKGFSVIQAVALAELDGLTTPNAYGQLPLVDRDPARPNPDYFTHVDFIVERAETLGMFVGLLPTWGRYWKTGDQKIFTRENARTYGQFLGRRYKDRAIIWILGGDQNVTTAEERGIIDALAEGLKAGDEGRHLMTFHPRGPGQSSLQLQDAPWLAITIRDSMPSTTCRSLRYAPPSMGSRATKRYLSASTSRITIAWIASMTTTCGKRRGGRSWRAPAGTHTATTTSGRCGHPAGRR
jgi:hypothetical protein